MIANYPSRPFYGCVRYGKPIMYIALSLFCLSSLVTALAMFILDTLFILSRICVGLYTMIKMELIHEKRAGFMVFM